MGEKPWGYTANMSAEKQEEVVKYVSFPFEFARLEYIYIFIGSLKDYLEAPLE